MKREAHESTNQLLFYIWKRNSLLFATATGSPAPTLLHTSAQQRYIASPMPLRSPVDQPTPSGRRRPPLPSWVPPRQPPRHANLFSLLAALLNPRQIVKPKPGRSRLVSPRSRTELRIPQRRQWQPPPATPPPSSSSLASWTKVRVFAPDHR